ncbi:MAG: hypothetical protein ATN36_07645 [Epulopiscium sp. Nele67-Bin005]|nr:MAG: hypothetical protein ATN36_07645 [Epulopiscium sp. Nele67-Bin005]
MPNYNSVVLKTLSYSYYEFINNYYKILTCPIMPQLELFSLDYLEIKEDLDEIFFELPAILEEGEATQIEILNQLITMSQKIAYCFKELFLNQRQIIKYSITATPPDDVILEDLREWEKFEEQIIPEEISEQCVEYVFSHLDITDRTEAVRMILPFLPLRKTQNYFLHYVETALSYVQDINEPETLNLTLSTLREFLSPKSSTPKEFFTDIKLALEELPHITDYYKFMDELNVIGMAMNDLVNLSHLFYGMINSLCNILSFKELSFEGLTDLHPSYLDFYYLAKSILENDEDAEFSLTALEDRLEDVGQYVYEEYEDTIVEYEDDAQLNMLRIRLIMELADEFTFNMTDFPQQFSPETTEEIGIFIKDLEAYLKSTTKKEAKINMQYMLSLVPFIMTPDQFEDYLLSGLTATSNQVKMRCVALLAGWIKDIKEEME